MRPDYRLCNQPVTVYNRFETEAGSVFKKTLIPRAFFDFKANYTRDKQGENRTNTFLLIIPRLSGNPDFVFDDRADNENTYTLKNGTKVLPGEGGDISTEDEWRKFVPGSVSGLVMVKNADPKYYGGKLTHVEAGG